MDKYEEASIREALALLERAGAHGPATAAAAYVEHVPILLNEIDRLRREMHEIRQETA